MKAPTTAIIAPTKIKEDPSLLMVGDRRITINQVPTDDHTHRVLRVSFETVGMGRSGWVPAYQSEKFVRNKFPKMDVGYTNKGFKEVKWPESYLLYLKMIDADEGLSFAKENQIPVPLASIWEFCIVTPSTD